MVCRNQLLSRSTVLLASLVSSFTFFLISLIGCEKSPIVPDQPKNPREFSWEIDTLSYPGSFQTLMEDIWGSDPSNAWTVGYNATSSGKMYHFDGKQWSDIKLYTSQGGWITPGINLNAIHGFSAENIWSVGERHYTVYNPSLMFLDSSLIIHFDGQRWTESPLSRGRELFCVWGSRPDDIWAAGLYNTLFHFNGASWEKFPIWTPSQGMNFLSIAGIASDNVYMIGSRKDVVQPIDTIAYFLYRFNGLQWAVVDSSIRTADPSSEYKFGPRLFVVEGTMFSIGYGVYRRTDDSWLRMSYTDWGLLRLRGINTRNLFAVGEESQIYHYNGSDWYRYSQFTGIDKVFTSVWTNGEEAFVIGHNGRQSFVLHGK